MSKLLFALVLFCLSTHAYSKHTNTNTNTVWLSNSIDWPPYAWVDDNKTLRGSDIEILRKTLDKIGFKLDYIQGIPLKRLSKVNNKLGFNAVLAATYTEQRAVDHYFSNPYREESIGLYIGKREFNKFNNLKEMLEAGLVGAYNGAGYYGEDVKALKLAFPNSFYHSETGERRIAMLLANRVDFIIQDIPYVENLYEQNQVLSGLSLHSVLIRQKVRFMFVKQAFEPDFIRGFNSALGQVLEGH